MALLTCGVSGGIVSPSVSLNGRFGITCAIPDGHASTKLEMCYEESETIYVRISNRGCSIFLYFVNQLFDPV